MNVMPKLSYMTGAARSFYKITGNKATVQARSSANATDQRGQVKVEFTGGVQTLEIRYRTTGRESSSRQRIYISPITIRAVIPPPTINEDGLSFVKQVLSDQHITTCETLEYAFYIQNTNCDGKYVNSFIDELDPDLTWESVVLDDFNAEHNDKIEIDGIGSNKLEIKNLWLPGTSTVKLMATAVFDEDADGERNYDNQALIEYDRLSGVLGQLPSENRETLEATTSAFVTKGERYDPATVEIKTNLNSYVEDSEIEVELEIISPNEIHDSWMDFEFNEDFRLVPGSIEFITKEGEVPIDHKIATRSNDDPFFTIVGLNYGDDPLAPGDVEGFTLPSEPVIIRFKLKAPDEIRDADGNLITNDENKDPLVITYSFSAGMYDPCLSLSLDSLNGIITLPYGNLINNIITNRNTTTRIRK
jgi:hypothetical protein